MNVPADPDAMLHLVLSDDAGAWRACRACCSPADTALVLDAAVMRLIAGQVGEWPCRLAVSAPDAQARGLTQHMAGSGVEFIDDAGAIDLIAAHRRCLSWR